jgi:glutamate mutase epsilon subunit
VSAGERSALVPTTTLTAPAATLCRSVSSFVFRVSTSMHTSVGGMAEAAMAEAKVVEAMAAVAMAVEAMEAVVKAVATAAATAVGTAVAKAVARAAARAAARARGRGRRWRWRGDGCTEV